MPAIGVAIAASVGTAGRAPLPLKGLILGVDLDGVCADFYGKMREVAAEWQERPVDELPKDVTYGLKEWGIGTGSIRNSTGSRSRSAACLRLPR